MRELRVDRCERILRGMRVLEVRMRGIRKERKVRWDEKCLKDER